MTWDILPLADREKRLRGNIAAGLKLPEAPHDLSNIAVLSSEVSAEIDGAHQHIAYEAKQRFTTDADRDGLIDIGKGYGMAPHAAQAAKLAVTITGINASELSAAAKLQHSSGLVFTTDALASINGATASVAVTAEQTGISGNLAAGTTLTFVNPSAGIEKTATVTEILSEGRDIEETEAFRARLRFRELYPPMGGNEADYIRWAMEVPGVTHVWVTPNAMGLGTVSVRIAAYDDLAGPLPTETMRQAVADHIGSHIDDVTGMRVGRPSGADVYVIIPELLPIDLEFSRLIPSDEKTVAALAAKVAALLRTIGQPNGTIRHSWITGAISNTVGEDYHTLTAPAADVMCGVNQLPILNSIKSGAGVLWSRT